MKNTTIMNKIKLAIFTLLLGISCNYNNAEKKILGSGLKSKLKQEGYNENDFKNIDFFDTTSFLASIMAPYKKKRKILNPIKSFFLYPFKYFTNKNNKNKNRVTDYCYQKVKLDITTNKLKNKIKKYKSDKNINELIDNEYNDILKNKLILSSNETDLKDIENKNKTEKQDPIKLYYERYNNLIRFEKFQKDIITTIINQQSTINPSNPNNQWHQLNHDEQTEIISFIKKLITIKVMRELNKETKSEVSDNIESLTYAFDPMITKDGKKAVNLKVRKKSIIPTSGIVGHINSYLDKGLSSYNNYKIDNKEEWLSSSNTLSELGTLSVILLNICKKNGLGKDEEIKNTINRIYKESNISYQKSDNKKYKLNNEDEDKDQSKIILENPDYSGTNENEMIQVRVNLTPTPIDFDLDGLP